MAYAKVTLIGVLAYDRNFFDVNTDEGTGLVLPTPNTVENYYVPKTPVDNLPLLQVLTSRENIIDTIIERAGDFPMLYPDPVFLAHAMYSWSVGNQYKWSVLIASALAEYNPYENYDRYSDISREDSAESTSTGVFSETAFNSTSAREKTRNEGNGESSTSEVVTEHVHGNIGVRSAQELIMQQREIAQFNIYDIIARDFIDRWCVERY